MNISRYISKLFYPEKCVFCGRTIPFLDSFCHNCALSECNTPESFCCYCNSQRCHCEKTDRRLRHITAPYIYTNAAKEIIISLKFRKKKHYSSLLSEGIVRKVIEDFSDVSFDFVTFVPTNDKVKRQRGYNQSELIALNVADRLFLPCVDALVKTKDTAHQHYLSAEMRQKNLSDAISVKPDVDIKGKTVLVCDDIKTTGSTLLVCQELLLTSGASDVYCAVAAIPIFGKADIGIDKTDKKI